MSDMIATTATRGVRNSSKKSQRSVSDRGGGVRSRGERRPEGGHPRQEMRGPDHGKGHRDHVNVARRLRR